MRVALFVTCLVDLMRPEIAIDTLALLQAAGCVVEVPPSQTCCGQPGYNSGERQTARALAQQFVEQFEAYDYVVLPSGSCAGMIKLHYDDLLQDDPPLQARMHKLAARVLELSQFLQQVARPENLPLQNPEPKSASETLHFTYHDSCSGLRELGIASAPRALLSEVVNLKLTEMRDCRACCGFGGTFSLKYGAISSAIADEKCAQIQATGAQAVVLGDLGCMLNIEGRLRRTGDAQTQVLHLAQVLAHGITAKRGQ